MEMERTRAGIRRVIHSNKIQMKIKVAGTQIDPYSLARPAGKQNAKQTLKASSGETGTHKIRTRSPSLSVLG